MIYNRHLIRNESMEPIKLNPGENNAPKNREIQSGFLIGLRPITRPSHHPIDGLLI